LKAGTAKSIQYFPKANASSPVVLNDSTVLVEFAAIAKQKITDGFIDFTQPAVGGTPDLVINASSDTTKFDTSNTTISWAEAGTTGVWTTFTAGKTYTATITLKAQPGSIFDVAANTAGTLTPVFRILTLTPGAVVKYPKSSSNSDTIVITVVYPALPVASGGTITPSAISVSSYTTGGALSSVTFGHSNTGNTAATATWTAWNGSIFTGTPTTVALGTPTQATVTLTANAGWTFGSDGAFSGSFSGVTGVPGATVNTSSASISNSGTTLSGVVITIPGIITAGGITVSGTFVAGTDTLDALSFTHSITGVGTITATWTEDGVSIADNDPTTVGKTYVATISVPATTNYVFGTAGGSLSGSFTVSGGTLGGSPVIGTGGTSVTGLTITLP